MAPEENYAAVKLDDFSQKELLQMLDKSIAEEIDLENKLLEITECKEELSSKLFITNQALFSMKMNVEHILSRLYEGEYFAELFKEIAKDMVSQIQILESNLSRSLQQEKVLSSKILEMESALQKSDCNCTKPDLCQPPVINGGDEKEFATNFEELNVWKEKVKVLEEKLKDSGAKLRKEYVSDEDGQFHQYSSEMEDVIESTRHSLFIAESRAESAEAKLVELTESHLELTEELEFLKGSERSGEKISSLEKQVRDLEKQLLHTNASSEASQEQQNMLYSAIWDMETLIEDLKSKAAKAETKLEDAEERCLMLAETNSELNKEIDLCKSRGESLEASLKEANRVKVARAKDINGGTKLITDMVMQLSGERERLQEQLHSLARENRILMEELRRMRKNGSETTQNDKIETDKETCSSVNNNVAGIGGSVADSRERSSSTSNQVNGPSEEAEMSNEAEEEGSSTSIDNGSEQYDASTRRHKHEVGEPKRAKRELYLSQRYFLMAVLLLLLVIAAGGMTVMYKQETLASFLSNYVGL